MTLVTIFTFTLTFFVGMWFSEMIHLYKSKKESRLLTLRHESMFSKLKENIIYNNCSFDKRINSLIYMDMYSINDKPMKVLFDINKNTISIYDENDIHDFYSSTLVDSKLIDDIIILIGKKFGKEIDNVVNILGMEISKNEFERLTNINIDSLIQNSQQPISMNFYSESQEEKKEKFNIDLILDKIIKDGLESLSKEERDFLDDYSKK